MTATSENDIDHNGWSWVEGMPPLIRRNQKKTVHELWAVVRQVSSRRIGATDSPQKNCMCGARSFAEIDVSIPCIRAN